MSLDYCFYLHVYHNIVEEGLKKNIHVIENDMDAMRKKDPVEQES